jgi:hypothetical protein
MIPYQKLTEDDVRALRHLAKELDDKAKLLPIGKALHMRLWQLTVSSLKDTAHWLDGLAKMEAVLWDKANPNYGIEPPKKKIVVAGNYKQYRSFLQTNHLSSREYEYRGSPESCEGLHDVEIVTVGDFTSSRAWKFLETI